MVEKIKVHHGERIVYPREEMSKETIDALEDLKVKLAEQDMILSIFRNINAISADVYNTIKNDYRKAFNVCNEAKNQVSKIVMDKFEPADDGTLGWVYSSIDNSLSVYIN